jgi:hypothetical protein
MCQRRGSLLCFVPRDRLQLLTPDDAAGTYTFNRHATKHRFCTVCGIHCYGEGIDRSGNAVAAINVRCLEGLDLASIEVKHFDGRKL